jgi:hypothetical protein
MKTNSINPKNYLRIFTTSILRRLKIKPNTCKNISPILKQSQILGPIQILASSLKKHDYNNLAFESPCKQELRNNVPQNK